MVRFITTMTPKWIGLTPICLAIGSSSGDSTSSAVPVSRKQPTTSRNTLIISSTAQPGACVAVIAFETVPATPLMVSNQPNMPATETIRKNVPVRNSVRAALWNKPSRSTSR